jgi:hypothetical protein
MTPKKKILDDKFLQKQRRKKRKLSQEKRRREGKIANGNLKSIKRVP